MSLATEAKWGHTQLSYRWVRHWLDSTIDIVAECKR